MHRWVTMWQCTHSGGGVCEFRSGGLGSQGRLPGGVVAELAFEEFSRQRARQPSGCGAPSRACSGRRIVWWCLWDVALLESAPCWQQAQD